MSALTPGRYRATVRGVADTDVTLTESARNGTPWASFTPLGTLSWYMDSEVTGARPLIVLDFDSDVSAEVVGDLRYAVTQLAPYTPRRAFIAEIADQIEAQTKPARIPEPSRAGKVLAHTPANNTRREFIRFGGRVDTRLANWYDLNSFGSTRWDELIDPTLIREGVTT